MAGLFRVPNLTKILNMITVSLKAV